MIRLLLALTLSAVLVGCGNNSQSYFQSPSDTKAIGPRIGIVVPIAHQALDDMIEGFVTEIRTHYGDAATIDVRNAHGDDIAQQAIIKMFDRQDYNLIVPIGTDVTLMTVSMTSSTRPIVGLDVLGEAMPGRSNLTGVMEATVHPTIDFLVSACPDVRKIAIVYSAGDKPYQQARTAMDYAEEKGLATQGLLIQELRDLYPLANRIQSDVDMIVILKDHVVASGVATLAQIAERRGIAVYTSDEGSVIEGGSFALGNREYDIGKLGAEKAIAILEGANPQEVGIDPVKDKSVFVGASIEASGIGVEAIESTANIHGYTVKYVTSGVQS
ncbi:Uncharacterized protein RP367 [Chlamydiales bacterium SCGC AG-110-P3]|nr:Uncharacterized protein RP367 [Chlamydiales bacterium SCGC AG-110-P3]